LKSNGGRTVAAEILVLNAGSSNLKVGLFRAGGGNEPEPLLRETVDWSADHAALADIIGRMSQGRPGWQPAGIGHRIVHGGTRHAAPVRVDAAVRAELEALVPLAPLHQPANLAGIDAAERAFPGVPQVACFDTAFHRSRPFVSEAFALPREYFDSGVRRYGFHGLSYESVAQSMRRLAPDVAAGRLVVCHLGNGASLCAMQNGRSVETTMGFTALDGLPMGTRCGQLDPGVLLYLLDHDKRPAAEVAELLYRRSGLLGLSGVSSDMRELLASDSEQARAAVDYFVYRVTYFMGALTAALGGLDGVVFTGGIGENAAVIRERICRNLGWLGLELDAAANAVHGPRISTSASRVSAWVVPTDEDRVIAAHVAGVLAL
jgi:acetate kinase